MYEVIFKVFSLWLRFFAEFNAKGHGFAIFNSKGQFSYFGVAKPLTLSELILNMLTLSCPPQILINFITLLQIMSRWLGNSAVQGELANVLKDRESV